MSRAHRKGDLSHLGQFMSLPYTMLDSPDYLGLSSSAKRLLVDVARQYSGKNNGSLSPSWELMKDRGWVSSGTLDSAKKEIRATRLITVTRKGTRGQNGKAELWALAWFSLDWHKGMDIEPRGHDYLGYLDLKASKVTSNANDPRLKLVKGALKAAGKM